MRGLPLCGIVPPHILRNIAENGEPSQRRDALVALELSSRLRGERDAVVEMARLAIARPLKRRAVYDARHGRRLPGILARREGEAPSDDRAVDEAYDGAGKTYDFFHTVMGRNSIDNRGMRLDSTVHFGDRYANAQWNGRRMIYGDGDRYFFHRFTRSLDVIAHELTHGVTQHSAAFDYEGESGALSEHFSDVFGVLVRQYASRQTAAKADWLVGTKLFTRRVNGDAIRSMKAPGMAYDDPILGRDPQPGHMRDYVQTDFDDGGVHVNSGIPNLAFHRVAVLLGGFAWEVAGRIWYTVLTQKLRPNATFQQCADATFETAAELWGRGSEPQLAVAEGWKTVGITPAMPSIRQRLRLRLDDRVDLPMAGAEIPSNIV